MKMNEVIGMLALGGGMAASGAAGAAIPVTTIDYGYPANSDVMTTPIYLAQATLPEYYFGGFGPIQSTNLNSGLVSGYVDGRNSKADLGLVFEDTTTSVPLTLGGFQAAANAGTLVVKNNNTSDGLFSVTSGPDAVNPGVDSYVYLLFFDDTFMGTPRGVYLGQADIGADGSLTSISYAPIVPEPQAWVLLMAGVGMAGGALRGERRRRAAALAA